MAGSTIGPRHAWDPDDARHCSTALRDDGASRRRQAPPRVTPIAGTVPDAAARCSTGSAAIAYGVKDNGFSTFLLIFYNQVLGMDAGWSASR